jgi:hypothetical protein
MKYLPLALLLVPLSATAANGGMGEAITATARATGMSYQFGTRCGFDKTLMARHKAKFEMEARQANATLPAGQQVNVGAEFQTGYDEADKFYDSIKDAAMREQTCQAMMVQIRQAVDYPSVLSLPTRGTRPR